MSISPAVKGMKNAFELFKHQVDEDAKKFTQEIEDAHVHRKETFSETSGVIAAQRREFNEIQEYVRELRHSNGGDPLSSESEGSSAPRSSEVANKHD
jgi:hypothetical protein